MAEIKVQRKSAVPWWLWLVLALLLVLLVWWLATSVFNGDDETAALEAEPVAVAGAEPAGAAGTGDTAGDAITDLATITNATGQTTLVGRAVRLDDVRVQEMVGDAAFWIGETGARVFVILDEQIPSPPPAVEGRVNVNTGQTVDVHGRIRAAADLPTGDAVEPREREAVQGQQFYIWAESAPVVTPEAVAPAGPASRR